jgi:autotransporter-associated beta strand protein
MRNQALTMKTLKFSLCLIGLLLIPRFASATLAGPYTADANTLFLVHFDEAAGSSVATNVGTIGGNFITTTNTSSFNGLSGNLPIVTTLLGKPSYSGFNNAVSATNTDGLADGVIGFDANHDGQFTSDSGSGTVDAISLASLNMGAGAGNSPFTIEALIKPSTITSGNQEIVCVDNMQGSASARGFQFRITSSGQLEFNMICQGGSDFIVPIPTSGPNAFVANAWYHVAITYDGATIRFYWTKVDPATTAANPIGSASWASAASDGANTGALVIGGENRGGEGEAFKGLIDEVRISNIARGPGDMQFNSAGVTIVQQPISQNIDNFMPVTFSVSASSTTSLLYQWRFDNNPIPNATNASYSIPSVQDTDAGIYDVLVSNTAGYYAASSNATLTVGAANFLAHRWSFTGNLVDSIGGANGTSNGTAQVSGGALVLDGSSNCFVSLPAHLLNGLNAVTFDFWATLGTNANNCRIFDFGNTNSTGGVGILPPQNYVYFSPHTSGGTQALGFAPGNQQSEVTLTAPGALDNEAVHVTCVVDPPDGTMSIYTNGVLEGSTGLTVPLSSLDDQLCWIGRSLFTADSFLVGSIDEFRIFDGALSAASVMQDDLSGPNSLPYNGPVILARQPTDAITVNGQPVTFSSAGIGHQPIMYQWYENSSAIPGATNADYTFTAATAQGGHTFHVAATNAIDGTNYFAVSTNATLTVVTPQTLTWIGVNGPAWNPTTPNWTNGTSLVAYGQYNEPAFSNLGLGQPTVDVTQAMYMVSLTANNSSGNYVIGSSTGSGSLNGLATLMKSGAGKFTVDLANNLSGGALISGGTLQIGNGDGAGTLGGGDVTNNATLDFDRTNSVSVTNVIHGTGTLQFDGTGSITLGASNDYSGVTLVNNGIVYVPNGSSLGTTAAGTTVANGGEIYINQNVDVSEPLTITGSGPAGGTGGALRKGVAGSRLITEPLLSAATPL